MSPSNEVYTAFSFVGFVLCAIPLYWHLEAWNTGTCLYMVWTGLGCLMQCINSILWNNNMIDKAPVYCDISSRIQVALNVAIPASSLCINRRLYKIARVEAVLTTRADRRRAVIQDLLVGVGIPILQIIAHFIVSSNRYNLFEDFGPSFSTAITPPTFVLFYAWPVVIGAVSLFYCIMTIFTFHKRGRQFSQVVSSSYGPNRGRYLRLMALSSIEILGTIPLGIYFVVLAAKSDVIPWNWTQIHTHYSAVAQFPAFIWKNEPDLAHGLEMFRWLLVACAFIFFAFFGFADEARQHYRLVYTSLASRIGYSTFTLHGSSHGTSSVYYVKGKGDISASVVTGGSSFPNKRRSSDSLTDHPSIPSIYIADDVETDFKIEQYSPSSTVASTSVESFDEPKLQGYSTLTVGIMPIAPPASVPPHFPDTIKTTMRPCSVAEAV